ncbi:hypothetical protein U1Q18_015747 [Sarracenia purpurea var. burkii]
MDPLSLLIVSPTSVDWNKLLEITHIRHKENISQDSHPTKRSTGLESEMHFLMFGGEQIAASIKYLNTQTGYCIVVFRGFHPSIVHRRRRGTDDAQHLSSGSLYDAQVSGSPCLDAPENEEDVDSSSHETGFEFQLHADCDRLENFELAKEEGGTPIAELQPIEEVVQKKAALTQEQAEQE